MLQYLLTLADESEHYKIEYLFNNYHISMLKLATNRFRNYGRYNYHYDAEDAVQNTFCKIARYIHNIDFSAEKNEIRNYVFSILINEIKNIIKDSMDFVEYDENADYNAEYSLEKELELREKFDEVVAAIESLDERYSTTLYYHYCKEMVPDEIAAVMGISVKTVYTRLSRGKALLRRKLEGMINE